MPRGPASSAKRAGERHDSGSVRFVRLAETETESVLRGDQEGV